MTTDTRKHLGDMKRLEHSLETRTSWWIVALFIWALLVRMVFVLVVPVKPTAGGDPEVFEETASAILREGVPHSQEGYAPRSPLYSFFVAEVYAITSVNHQHVFLAQALFGAAGVIILFLTLRRIGWMVASIGALLASVHPLTLFYTKQLLTESLYTFLVILTIYLAVRTLNSSWNMGLIAGAAMGLTILCRAEAMILSACFQGLMKFY